MQAARDPSEKHYTENTEEKRENTEKGESTERNRFAFSVFCVFSVVQSFAFNPSGLPCDNSAHDR